MRESPAEFFAEDFEVFWGLEADKFGVIGRSIDADAKFWENITTAIAIHDHD
jgi:hypothetical protein